MPISRSAALLALAFFTALTAPAFAAGAAAAPAHQVPDTMAQRMLACGACHGKEGRATPDGYQPRIAGKPAGYLYNQLLNFRERRRQNATMQRFVDLMSDDYLREIAEHYAGLDLPYPPPEPAIASPEVVALGRSLVHEGDPARGLPACTACHGATMTGVAPTIPGLLGLPRAYLGAQLNAWRQGQRHAQAPDCMADIARRLSDTQLNAVASWLAAQPVPADSRPAATLPAPMPARCGGTAP